MRGISPFRDVTISGYPGDSQILATLVARFITSRDSFTEHYPWPLGHTRHKPDRLVPPVTCGKPGGARVDFMTPGRSDPSRVS